MESIKSFSDSKLSGKMEGENRIEQSVESQISQESEKLNTNLETLKNQVDEMGGMKNLIKKIEKLDSQGKDARGNILGGGAMAVAGSIMAISSLLIGLNENTIEHIGANNAENYEAFVLVVGTLYSTIGVAISGIGSIQKIKSWIESNKLKNIKEEVETAGI